jgi:hypothetical protein
VLELILETRIYQTIRIPGATDSRTDLDKVIEEGKAKDYQLGSLAGACLQREPSDRPSAQKVLASLYE